ncbi:MAG: chloride channel protein [Lachnospiraceae bacterium]|nr:chloride channel protein [Lachnospiraceae bacterium]
MTSKSLFLVRSKENHKRRIWVWIVTMLIQLAFYPGIMTVYLARIRNYNAVGRFDTAIRFKDAMFDAAADALGFKDRAPWVVLILAVMIGAQGFAYLYNRKKVDMYHSVPVSSKSRFAVVYINGIIIYLVSYLLSVILALGLAGINGAVNGRVFIECGLAFVLNVLYFLVIYNTVILAMMLAGNIIIAGGIAIVLLGIDFALELLLGDMKEHFFSTADYVFADDMDMKFCVLADYANNVNYWRTAFRLPDIINGVLPFYLKFLVFAVFFGILAYLFYKKRPAEAAGRAIAFPAVKPVLKIAVAVTAGIMVCDLLYISIFRYVDATKLSIGSVVLLFGGAGLAALLCSICLEAAYEFDVRAAIKHIASTCTSVVIAMAVLCIYFFDVFGYDNYVPEPDKVESAAVHFFYDQSYFEIDESDGSSRSIGETDYLKENMFLTDIDAICSLIEKGRESEWNPESMEDGRYIYVLFRLKSGKEVSRRYVVDFADSSNEELLDRVLGTKEFKEGHYQIFKAEDMIRDNVCQVSYSNGTMDTKLSVEASKLREAWMKDMEQFDFSLARNNRQCGHLDFEIEEYRDWRLPVYENFENTISYLEEEGVYVPAKVRAEDVASITVINWNYDKQNGDAWDRYYTGSETRAAYVSQMEYQRREIYDNPDEIAEIVDAIFPEEMCYDWKWESTKTYERGYDVYITYKTDAEYKYIPTAEYKYEFLSGQVPDFVEEMTSYTPEQYINVDF